MRLVDTTEQAELRSAMRTLLAKECPTSLVREMTSQDSDGFPESLWQALAAAGVHGMAFDEEHGGSGGSLYDMGLFFAEAGRALCPSVVYSTVEFGLAIDRLGDTPMRARFLPAVSRGDLKATVAAWNPSDAGDIRPTTAAKRTRGGWLLSGTSSFVRNVATADAVLLTATTGDFAEPERRLGFVVTPEASGWRATPVETMAGDKQGHVVLDDVFVPDSDVLDGTDGSGFDETDLRWIAHTALGLQCMEMAGGAEAVLERTVDYVKNREQFGRAIAGFQAAQHLIADMHIAVVAARLAAANAVFWLGAGGTATRQVAIAKMRCSEAYKHVTLTAHQLHGGMGYVRETDLHLWSQRAKVTEILGGTADVAAGWLAREVGLVR